MMSVQIVEIAGEKMAVLPMADYERLLELAEDRADLEAALRAELRRAGGEEYVPAELVDRILNGENPLRVWRKYRGMTLEKLSEASGVSVTQISDIETRKRFGRPAQFRQLAGALGVSVEDILPDD